MAQDSITYTYAAWGALEHVIDPLGTNFLYSYDERSRLIRTNFGSDSVTQSWTYDKDNRIRKDSVSNIGTAWPRWTHAPLRRSFFELDAQGRQLSQQDSAWYGEQTRTTYTDLGYLTTSYHAENAKTVGLSGFLGTYYHIDRDTVTLDGLGNRRRAKNMWETGMNGIGTPVVTDYTYAYRANVGRVDSMTAALSGTRTFAYDSAGNEVFSSLNGLSTCSSSEDRASFYDGLNRLAAEQRRWLGDACGPTGARMGSLEEYRYDALGRRVWVHGKRECDQVPAGYPEPVGDLALQCRLPVMRRTVWDGAQELAEVQAPGAPAPVAMREQDVGHYAALPLDFRSSPPKDPNRYYGQVVYTTGLAVDQPLSVVRLGYADRPDANSYTQWARFGVTPIWDRQGTAKLGVFSNGAWAKQLVPSPTVPCQASTSPQRCLHLVWAKTSSAYDLPRG